MRSFLQWTPWMVLWIAVWLAVGESLYRGLDWNRGLSGLIGVAAASVLFRLLYASGRLPAARSNQPKSR